MTRRALRIKVMQALYACMLTNEDPQEMYNRLLRNVGADKTPREDDFSDDEFIARLYTGVLQNRERYAAAISGRLKNWNEDRLALVDKILLMQGLHEMLSFPQIPVRVTINEYIEIAKAYSTANSGRFVNGVLDALHEDLNSRNEIKKYDWLK